MARRPRVDVEGYFYHVLNRANAKQIIFKSQKDYQFFESTLTEAIEKFQVRLIAYCIMPNHFHLVLYCDKDGEIQKCMQWLTVTHTQRLHVRNSTIGHGHIYQGRYKSFVVETDVYLNILLKYVEQNPLRANLVQNLKQWRWGSYYRRKYGTDKERKLLDDTFVILSGNYEDSVHQIFNDEQVTLIRESVNKGKPLGSVSWMKQMVKRFKLESCMRNRGRPRKGT